MSDHAIEKLHGQLATLEKLVAWMRALLVGAFLLGGWATTLQLRVTFLDDRVAAIEADRRVQMEEYRRWRESVTADVSATRADVIWIRQAIAGGVGKS